MHDDVTPTESSTKLPSVSDLKRELSVAHGDTRSFERKYGQRMARVSISAQEGYEHLKGLRDHYGHKKKWSWFLLFAIAFMILFQSGIIIGVGMNVLDLTKYKWLLPALMVQNLGQIIGLAVFVVRSLFK